MVKKTADKGIDGFQSSSELSENMPRQNFRLGDITWVKHSASLWWPAQVIDEACVSSKPKKKTSQDALVRLYGTCQYLYVDPWKSNVEFETILKKEGKTAMEAFHEVLQKELSHVRSLSDYEEGAVKSKAKTSSTNVRKQEVGSNATTGVASRKGRKQEGAKQSSPAHDKGQAIHEASSNKNSAEGLRDKRASVVQDRKGRKTATLGTSVAKREGVRRSGCTNATEYTEAAEDSTSKLHDTSASENATEVGDITSDNKKQHNDSVVYGTHIEIKAMVRDILLGDIISRQHAAEMAYVNEVILGICHATEENGTDGATAVTKDGRGIKRTGSRLEADSSNVTPRPRKGKVEKATEDASQVTDIQAMNSSPSRDAAMESGQRRARQIKIMQILGLIPPAGSPFSPGGLAAANRR